MILLKIPKFVQNLVHSSVALVWFVLIVLAFGSKCLPVRANPTSVVLELSVPPQAQYSDLVMQAKLLANESITRYFSQNMEISAIEISVIGDRSGDMVPILTMTVTRSEWQGQSQPSDRTKYYASRPLFQHRDDWEAGRVATQPRLSSPSGSVVASEISASQRRNAEIDQAFDEGRLTGEAAQDHLSSLD